MLLSSQQWLLSSNICVSFIYFKQNHNLFLLLFVVKSVKRRFKNYFFQRKVIFLCFLHQLFFTLKKLKQHQHINIQIRPFSLIQIFIRRLKTFISHNYISCTHLKLNIFSFNIFFQLSLKQDDDEGGSFITLVIFKLFKVFSFIFLKNQLEFQQRFFFQ